MKNQRLFNFNIKYNMSYTSKEIKRLKFEELLWIIFAIISLLNVYGDKIEEEYVTTNQETYQG